MKHALSLLTLICLLSISTITIAEETTQSSYTVGIDDILEISILQPEKMLTTVSVAPDGTISFPYIGNIHVKGMTLEGVRDAIQTKLADGYMKYPVASVSLRECRSRKFFVYGEVTKPGTYAIEENVTVLKAISMAGGFTKFGSSSQVKVLRRKTDGPGYEMIKVNIRAVMNGNSKSDIVLKPEDIVTVSEGVF